MKTLELTQTELRLIESLMEDLKEIPVSDNTGGLYLFDSIRDCSIMVIESQVPCIDSVMEKIKQTKLNN